VVDLDARQLKKVQIWKHDQSKNGAAGDRASRKILFLLVTEPSKKICALTIARYDKAA
jgi:hypothetical protein